MDKGEENMKDRRATQRKRGDGGWVDEWGDGDRERE